MIEDYPEKGLYLLKLIISELDIKKIQYCHWKSNFHLERALTGIDDWDVLIDRNRFEEFVAVLLENGFKSAKSIFAVSQPGIYHFYGLDEQSGMLVHVHAYSRILSGDSLVKSYALPMEDMLLNHTHRHLGMPIPDANAEMIVFLFRLLLKYQTLFDTWLVERHSQDVLLEYLWLDERADVDGIERLLNEYFPRFKKFDTKEALILLGSKGQCRKKIKLARGNKYLFSLYRRFSSNVSLLLTIKTITKILVNKYFRKRKFMRLTKGGLTVTLIGPQATGKSTLGNKLKKWLGKEFEVQYKHVGKPPATMLTFLPRTIIPFMRFLTPKHRSTYVEKKVESASKNSSISLSYLHIARKLMLAWDRKILLNNIYRQRNYGMITICDRYPSENRGAVDGSMFTNKLIDAQKSKIKRWLMRMEVSIYENINPPDLVVSLTAPIDLAITRANERNKKGPKDTDYVRFRHEMKEQPIFTRSPIIEVSTVQDLNETFDKVKREVWKYL